MRSPLRNSSEVVEMLEAEEVVVITRRNANGLDIITSRVIMMEAPVKIKYEPHKRTKIQRIRNQSEFVK